MSDGSNRTSLTAPRLFMLCALYSTASSYSQLARLLCRRYKRNKLRLKSAISSASRFTIGALRLDPIPSRNSAQSAHVCCKSRSRAKRTGPRASTLVTVVPEVVHPSWLRHGQEPRCHSLSDA